jgi:glyceraldehyde-3-phosphate dehydrogenase (NAD(P))
MHAIWFQLRLEKAPSMEGLLKSVEANRRVAVTYKKSANAVFSFGRDHGHYGRILNETVFPVK